MLRRTWLPVAGLAFTVVSISFAQTPTAPPVSGANPTPPTAPTQSSSTVQQTQGQPNDTAPLLPQTVTSPGSTTSYPSAPPPTPQPSGAQSNYPPYLQKSTTTSTVPPATPAGPPLLVPAPPTAANPAVAYPGYEPATAQVAKVRRVRPENPDRYHYGSTYIPVDSWIYPEMARLYGMGFADTLFLGLRPWTRQSVLHMIEATEDSVVQSGNEQAMDIVSAMKHELIDESTNGLGNRGPVYGTKDVYDRVLGISGPTLHDSYHLGETIANDYGRPYEPGFNNLLGFHELGEWGRFSLDVRGEYQHAPGGPGYSFALASELSQGIPGTGINGDTIPYSGYNLHQPDIPQGPIPAANPFHLIEATLSYHLLGHEISGGKSDAWLGPAQGGAMAWSNNADNIYSFRINRVEPLHIPLLSRFLGPFRYDFFYGDLKGHTDPNDDWVHSETASFKPTKNLEFSFQRTIVFGGKGHEPVTLHTFLKGFFDPSDTTGAEKFSRSDPGARFGDFSASWRLPYLEKFATLYVDSEAHDDVSPISAPRRAAYRTGVLLSQIPGLRKLDFRVEAATTDPGVARSIGGTFNYFETIQTQAYTNEGQLMGDTIGREAKGGNAWLTYHLSGNEWVQISYLNKKNEKDFIVGLFNPVTNTFGPGGTTQNQFKVDVMKRFAHDTVELHAWVQYERWKAPSYLTGLQNDTATAFQLTFFPKLQTSLPRF